MSKMTPSQITDALKLAAQAKHSNDRQDIALGKVSRVLKKLSVEDQLMVIAAYQSSLILEIAGNDTALAVPVWQAAWALSGTMIKDMQQGIEGAN